MKTQSELRVRYSETDQMGIVHHSQYVNYFEVGRTDFIRDMDRSFSDIEDEGLYLPVIGVQLSYKTPAKYEDLIIVETTIEEYNGIRIKFHYKAMRKVDQVVVAEGTTEHCWANLEMRPIQLKKVWPELHDKIKSCIEDTK